MRAAIQIGDHWVGPGRPCYLIAEAGVNHNGAFERACRLVDAARAAGADAVKFQAFRADRLVTRAAPKAAYQRTTTGAAENQYEMLKRLELDDDAQRELARYCAARGIPFLATPFDEASADLLEALNVPAFKIGSGDLTNLPLLAHVARKGKPLIVSTGMADLDEVRAAVETIGRAGGPPLILLHCVSNYPADPAVVNLRAMATLAREFDVPVGYSDHTLGLDVPLAAVALGACVIEKHFTLDRNLPGPDHQASADPTELAALAQAIRRVESALGDGRKRPAPAEADTAAAARRSLVAARAIKAGAILAAGDIALRRPGTGLPPARLAQVLGCRARVAIPAGTLLQMEMLEEGRRP